MNKTPRFAPTLVLAFIAALSFAGTAVAAPWWLRGTVSADQDFLPPDVAFRVAAHLDGQALRIRWVVADGYYLYRSKIEARAESPDLVVGTPILPPGTPLNDGYFGSQEVYFNEVTATLPFQRLDYGAHPLQIKVIYQGCAKAGLCYPPITKVLFPDNVAASSMPAARTAPKGSSDWEFAGILGGGAAFLLAGLVLRRNRTLAMPAP